MNTNPYLTTKQLAAEFGLSEAALKQWRTKGTGPPFFQTTDADQARKLYPRVEVEKWIEGRMVRPGRTTEAER